MYINLRGVMRQKGITSETLARVLGVHRNTIQNKLEGESEFTVRQAEIICDTFFPEYKASYLFRWGENVTSVPTANTTEERK